MMSPLALDAQKQLLQDARTHHGFLPEALPENTIQSLYELTRWAPTAFNAAPARFVFVQSAAAKESLCSVLSPGNVAQTQAAPLTVIVAIDRHFYDRLPELFPAFDARPIYANNPALVERAGLQNASMQAAYLIMAARNLGLDCGPMTGFDVSRLDALFFPAGDWTANILINIGHGDSRALHPRGPRLPFADACRIR